MVHLTLKFKADLENITNLKPADPDNFQWYLKARCGQCGEANDKWIYLTASDVVNLPGSKGTANLHMKCKLCARDNSIEIVEGSIKPYTAEDSGKFAPIVQFDCRGIELFDFSPRDGWVAEGAETGTKFNAVDLSEGEWVEYDEKNKESVGIYEISSEFTKH
eukprot:Colp12_sorted_trinity150504_noHs@20298